MGELGIAPASTSTRGSSGIRAEIYSKVPRAPSRTGRLAQISARMPLDGAPLAELQAKT